MEFRKIRILWLQFCVVSQHSLKKKKKEKKRKKIKSITSLLINHRGLVKQNFFFPKTRSMQ